MKFPPFFKPYQATMPQKAERKCKGQQNYKIKRKEKKRKEMGEDRIIETGCKKTSLGTCSKDKFNPSTPNQTKRGDSYCKYNISHLSIYL